MTFLRIVIMLSALVFSRVAIAAHDDEPSEAIEQARTQAWTASLALAMKRLKYYRGQFSPAWPAQGVVLRPKRSFL